MDKETLMIKCEVGADGAGAVLRCGFGSTKMCGSGSATLSNTVSSVKKLNISPLIKFQLIYEKDLLCQYFYMLN
jgi:hypothetical protein